MSKTSLNIHSQFEAETPMEDTLSQLSQIGQLGSSALPISKRVASIFKEFTIGMKLAQHHNENENFGMDVLASHNLRLLHKRLEQIAQYTTLLQEKTSANPADEELWARLYEDSELICGFIKMQAFQDLPCYNHPGLSSMCLVLSGNAEVKQYALSHSRDDNNGQLKVKVLSSYSVSQGDAVYYESDSSSLTNLCTSSEGCVLLNVQLSWHNKIFSK